MKKEHCLKKLSFFLLICLTLCAFIGKQRKFTDLPKSPYAIMKEINWSDIKWTEGFLAEKFDLCRDEIIPAIYNTMLYPENGAQLKNLEIAAGIKEGDFSGRDWSDGDCYKWIESLAYIYAVTKNPEIDSIMDKWIDVIGKAQQPDGYISTNMTLQDRPPYMRYHNLERSGGGYHEMYNLGHLLTSACIHYRATGKDNFLNIAVKLADHLAEVFQTGAPELRVMQGNLPIIMGLVDIYRLTGQQRYLSAAQVALDVRGTLPLKSDHTQDHLPFREQAEAVGHAVFATYLYSGAADIFAETGEEELILTLDRIWQSAALRRTYITGGVGSIPNGISDRGYPIGEAFGNDYQLPNRTAYNETCANIGNAMWNWRMLLLTGDAKYTDIMERVLYNSMLSAVSIDGQKFFYPNPLEWDGNTAGHTRFFAPLRWSVQLCYCCPPSVARTIAGLGRWVYSVSSDTLWVHLYGSNILKTDLPGGSKIFLEQASEYPWEGDVKITLNQMPKKAVTIMLRIPGWVEGPALKINQRDVNEVIKPGTYFALNRKWSAGDVIELNLPMPVRLMEANPKVEENRNRVAVMRGPIVYCVETPLVMQESKIWKDGIYFAENIKLNPRKDKQMFGGVVVLEGKALTTKGRDQYINYNPLAVSPAISAGWDDILYRNFIPREFESYDSENIDIMLIPYYAWANRGLANMKVWIPLAR